MRSVLVSVVTVALVAGCGGSDQPPVPGIGADSSVQPTAPADSPPRTLPTASPTPSPSPLPTSPPAPTAVPTPDPAGRVVANVGELRYTGAKLVSDLRIRKHLAGQLGVPFLMPYQAFRSINQALDDELIRQSMPNLGITVSDSEVDEAIVELLDGVGAGLATQSEFRERLQRLLGLLRVSEADYRDFVTHSVIREKFNEVIRAAVSDMAEQAHVYRLLMSPDDEIEEMRAAYVDAVRLNAHHPAKLGEAFELIVQSYSRDDREIITAGGDMGWVPQGILTQYDYVIFELPVGELSEPVPVVGSRTRVFVFMVSERADDLEMDDENMKKLRRRAPQEWIDERRGEFQITADFDSVIYDWVVAQVR